MARAPRPRRRSSSARAGAASASLELDRVSLVAEAEHLEDLPHLGRGLELGVLAEVALELPPRLLALPLRRVGEAGGVHRLAVLGEAPQRLLRLRDRAGRVAEQPEHVREGDA